MDRPNVIATILKRYTTLVILIGLVILFSFLSPDFEPASTSRTSSLWRAAPSPTALTAILPLIVGEFDLSLGVRWASS